MKPQGSATGLQLVAGGHESFPPTVGPVRVPNMVRWPQLASTGALGEKMARDAGPRSCPSSS